MKTKSRKKAIEWRSIQVDVAKIKPTPGNFKLKTEDGLARFRTSIESYGMAGTVILNADLTLIDGNTRWEKAKELGQKKIWASVPDRQLTSKEFTEFAAMYDYARAGEVDLKRIQDELGTTDSFFKKWGMELPEVAAAKLAELEAKEGVVNPTVRKGIEKEKAREIQLRPISLLFTVEEANEFLTLAEGLYTRLGKDNVTDVALHNMREAKARGDKRSKVTSITDLAMEQMRKAGKATTKAKRK